MTGMPGPGESTLFKPLTATVQGMRPEALGVNTIRGLGRDGSRLGQELAGLGGVGVQNAVITQHVEEIGQVLFEGSTIGRKKTLHGVQNLGLVFAFLQETDDFFARIVGAKGVPGGGVKQKSVFGNGDVLADFHGFGGIEMLGRKLTTGPAQGLTRFSW